MDRARKGKKLPNADWVSKTDPEAKIAKMKDGTMHLAYKPEHAVDLDTGAVIAAEIHSADEGEHDDVIRHVEGGGGEPDQRRSGADDDRHDRTDFFLFLG